MNKPLKQSFTLIELLVVIAIVGILAGVIIISTSSAIEKANIAKLQVFSNSIRDTLGPSMVSEWNFDNITGTIDSQLADGTSVADSWGTNNGLAYGPTLKDGSNCVSGKCLSYDEGEPKGNYIYFGNNSSLTFSSGASWTVEYWIFPTEGMFNTLSSPVNSTDYPLTIAPHWDTAVYFRDATGAYLSVFNIITTNKWQHLVYTCNGTTKGIDIYVNGIKKGTITANSSQMGFNYLGVHNTGGYNFQGKIDTVRLYSNVISAFEVKQQYYAGLNELLKNRGITQNEYSQRIAKLNTLNQASR
ncbi:MAG: prepilin-type N-terminal cleavage/methylation domain-containing protein [Candidatus Pacebacteria bacterium]|nr:prepilin-type N-terminal cleavage/methylation domain-containing protein [Candidatus Paceibacterota bacterium]